LDGGICWGLQKRWDRLRAGLDLVLAQRGADMGRFAGGANGLLARDYKGKNAERLVTRIDPGVVPLVARTARGHERQAAEELAVEDERRGAQAPRRVARGDYAGVHLRAHREKVKGALSENL
jgi:hypothetical protein